MPESGGPDSKEIADGPLPELKLTQGLEFEDKTPLDILTRREKEVIALIAQGLSNDKIIANLFITTAAVEQHINHIYRKLNVSYSNAEKRARVEVATKYIKQNSDFKNPFDGYRMYTPFTRRENEVLALVAQGLSNKAIGRKLSIQIPTVEHHITNILNRIGVDYKEQNPRVVMMLVSKAKLKIPTK